MASIAPLGKYQAFDDNGDPLVGGKLYTYLAGTSTPKATYTTAAGDVANTNPVILDSSGYADVWLGDGGYKFMLTDADDSPIFTVDNIGGSSSTAFGAEVNEISSNTSITSVYANSVNICTGSPTLSLLPASDAGEGFYFSVRNNGSGTVTIDPDAGETINGAATVTVPPGMGTLIITNGVTWYTLFGMIGTVTVSGNTTFTGTTTLTGAVAVNGTSSAAASISLAEDTDNGSNKVTISALATLAADYTLTLPPDDGDANEVLKTDGSGVTDWVTFSSLVPDGFLVGRSYAEYTANSNLATIPYDDSIPQIGEGTEIITLSHTPLSTTNRLRVRFQGMIGSDTVGDAGTLSLFLGGASNSVYAASCSTGANTGAGVEVVGEYEYVPGTISPQSFALRAGCGTGTGRMNGIASARKLGGVAKTTLIIEEIKAS